ncbi:MAG TPA: DUF4038 domain-containing protein [Sedimentisphaerales bacterium]|nr:DUF4038 domain-containing protein [Sedimentisphaerales bacterium]
MTAPSLPCGIDQPSLQRGFGGTLELEGDTVKTIDCGYGGRAKSVRVAGRSKAFLRSLAMAAVCLAFVKTGRADVAVWNRWEQTLASSSTYSNPYQQVVLSVIYTGPNGQKIKGYGFWDGGSTFKIRCMFSTPGIWTWATTCNPASDTGLHNKTGTIVVTPYSGDNVLYSKGYLKISSDKRYLTYADGDPFLWLGDTAWSAINTMTDDDWQLYVDYRVGQKFNVAQMICGTGWSVRKEDRNGNSPFLGAGTQKVGWAASTTVSDAEFRWNPAFWQGVDRKVKYANDHSMITFICAIGQNHNGHNFPKTERTQVELFARNLAARMMGNFVVFSPDADYYWTESGDWSGATLRASIHPLQLVTIHPEMIVNLYSQTPANSGTLGFYDKSYVDFAGFEVSNGWLASCHKGSPEYGEPWKPYSAPRYSCAAIDMPLGLYHRTPTKPIINLEVVYDCKPLQEHNAKCWAQPYPLRMTRSGGYLSMLSGAKGLTYGCGGVCYWGYQKNEAIGGGWTPLEPDDGLYKPSSDQMTYFFEVFSSLEWWRLEPAHELVLNQPAAPTTVDDPAWLTRMVMAKTHNGDLGVAYLPDNAQIQVDMSAFPAAMAANWFDPMTGKYEAVSGAIPAERPHTFVRPSGWEDAVLVLTDPTT